MLYLFFPPTLIKLLISEESHIVFVLGQIYILSGRSIPATLFCHESLAISYLNCVTRTTIPLCIGHHCAAMWERIDKEFAVHNCFIRPLERFRNFFFLSHAELFCTLAYGIVQLSESSKCFG